MAIAWNFLKITAIPASLEEQGGFRLKWQFAVSIRFRCACMMRGLWLSCCVIWAMKKQIKRQVAAFSNS